MDLRPIETPASPAERTTIEAAIAHDPLGSAARTKRHLLLPALHAVQRRFGYVSEGALGQICRALQVHVARAARPEVEAERVGASRDRVIDIGLAGETADLDARPGVHHGIQSIAGVCPGIWSTAS
jgi:hypothetical protein